MAQPALGRAGQGGANSFVWILGADSCPLSAPPAWGGVKICPRAAGDAGGHPQGMTESSQGSAGGWEAEAASGAWGKVSDAFGAEKLPVSGLQSTCLINT